MCCAHLLRKRAREIWGFMSQSCNDGSEMYKKCMMHVQVCCFANLKLSGFIPFSLLSPSSLPDLGPIVVIQKFDYHGNLTSGALGSSDSKSVVKNLQWYCFNISSIEQCIHFPVMRLCIEYQRPKVTLSDCNVLSSNNTHSNWRATEPKHVPLVRFSESEDFFSAQGSFCSKILTFVWWEI